jgi:Kef-type K+ transport system membrane component KefB
MPSNCGSRANGWQSDVEPFFAGVVIPRGEVGLFFAAIGRELRSGGNAVVNEATYTAIVGMVMVTTLIPPPLLSWSMNRRAKGVLTP